MTFRTHYLSTNAIVERFSANDFGPVFARVSIVDPIDLDVPLKMDDLSFFRVLREIFIGCLGRVKLDIDL